MGGKSCKFAGDKCEVKSPILGCIMEHCDCTCVQEEPKEATDVKQIKVEVRPATITYEEAIRELFGATYVPEPEGPEYPPTGAKED